jgi:hypothetical protein
VKRPRKKGETTLAVTGQRLRRKGGRPRWNGEVFPVDRFLGVGNLSLRSRCVVGNDHMRREVWSRVAALLPGHPECCLHPKEGSHESTRQQAPLLLPSGPGGDRDCLAASFVSRTTRRIVPGRVAWARSACARRGRQRSRARLQLPAVLTRARDGLR